MKKKHILLSIVAGVSIAGTAVTAYKMIKKKSNLQKKESKEFFRCGCNKPTCCDCDCYEDCKKDKERYEREQKIWNGEIILYEDENGDIKSDTKDILDKYKGLPMPKIEKLTLYLPNSDVDNATKLCEKEPKFKLIANNGGLEVDLVGDFLFYIGVCKPSKTTKELFLWMLANDKDIFTTPNGNVYTGIGPGGREESLVDLKIINQ